jgi:hypothetical protein
LKWGFLGGEARGKEKEGLTGPGINEAKSLNKRV